MEVKAHKKDTSRPPYYELVRHLVREHLRTDPCTVYEDVEQRDGYVCQEKGCAFSTRSGKTSYLTHTAVQHLDLSRRMEAKRKADGVRRGELLMYDQVENLLNDVWPGWKSGKSVELRESLCGLCDQAFRAAEDLEEHAEADHPPEEWTAVYVRPGNDGYLCQYRGCGADFLCRQACLKHLTDHHDLLLPSSGDVGKLDSSFLDAKAAVNGFTTDGESTGEAVDMSLRPSKNDCLDFSVGRQLSSPECCATDRGRKDSGPEEWKCLHCSYVYTDDASLKDHTRALHMDRYREIILQAGEKKYVCERCEVEYKSKEKMALHVFKAHKEVTKSLISDNNAWISGLVSKFTLCVPVSKKVRFDNGR